DPVAVEVLSDVLRDEVARGAALLLSSHQLDLVASVCSSVVIVDRGRVVLRGEVAALRTASAVRHLDVEFEAPTEWRPAESVVVSAGGRRHRVTLDAADADPADLDADARRAGGLVGWSFSPPDLSEVFLAAVGERGGDRGEREPGSP